MPITKINMRGFLLGGFAAALLTTCIWTLGGQGGQTGERVPNILIAGDSGCCVYGAESRLQTGWGECLSEALGGGVQISNHAIGGESTKSFIDEGRWAGLHLGIVAGDIVIIH